MPAEARLPQLPIRLPRCILRPYRHGDEAALVRHGNDRRVSMWLRDSFPFPYTLDDARNWVACADIWLPTRYLAIEVDGEVVGGVGIEPGSDVFRRSAEVGYWLGHAHWGRGILSEALPAVTAYAFARFDIIRLWAGVFAGNAASARVLEKSGFALEARLQASVWKHGRVMDQLVYALVRLP